MMEYLSLLVLVLAYIIGAIPTGFIIAQSCGIADITKHGSGNIGATNVGRMLGGPYFGLVFLIDVCKAFFFLYFVHFYIFDMHVLYLAALTLVLGNSYSVFLKGRGGKGIATSIGVLLFFKPLLLLFLMGIWFIIFAVTRIVGIASIAALVGLFGSSFLYAGYDQLLCVAIAVWCLYRHKNNIMGYIQQQRKKP